MSSSKNFSNDHLTVKSEDAATPSSSHGNDRKSKKSKEALNARPKKTQYKPIRRSWDPPTKASQSDMDPDPGSSLTNEANPMTRWYNQDMGEEPFHDISFVSGEECKNGLFTGVAQGATSTPGYIDFGTAYPTHGQATSDYN